MFALKGGIFTTQSPSELILNHRLNYNAHCKIEFGEYVQTHEEHNNDMSQRTLGAIATRPSNDAGSYYFISLQSGRRINRRSWTSLLMPEAVVAQVHRLARRAKATKQLTFTNIDNEDLDMERFETVGVIKNQPEFDEAKLDDFMDRIEVLRAKGTWTKDDIVKLYFGLLPEFAHKETGKYLDQRM